VPREGEVPTGVEEQDHTAKTLHDEGSPSRPHAIRAHTVCGGKTGQQVRGK